MLIERGFLISYCQLSDLLIQIAETTICKQNWIYAILKEKIIKHDPTPEPTNVVSRKTKQNIIANFIYPPLAIYMTLFNVIRMGNSVHELI